MGETLRILGDVIFQTKLIKLGILVRRLLTWSTDGGDTLAEPSRETRERHLAASILGTRDS